ncbi:neuronal acetylcholine receptor subunit alpha-6-like [Ruditapes philippinarum]|uniref:neuronal acetylcholine receptor subunit alpha-6-like n=1 Tax=Ruditapes philippinarum TaxID=129788 RepID=UPI00295A5DFF|nr:neuronal acetylcholine receptor subunit alpha-6-like [Ruditapes philippinarum]
MVAVLHLSWYDEMIEWVPNTYGGIYTLLTESESLWTPNFVLANTAAKLDKIGDDWQSIRLLFNGTAYYFPLGIYASACSADITLYPWDINICTLQFTPQGHLSTELTIKIPDNQVILDDFSENGAWKLLDTRVQLQNMNNYMAVDISFIIERRPRYAVINILLPVIFMAFLGNVVFLIPTESGERISYSITMLLAIAVFLTLVGDNLPKTSTPMPYFSYFLISLLVTGICVSCATIFNVRIYHKDDTTKAKGKWAKLVIYLDCSNRRKSKGSKVSFNDMKLSKCDEALVDCMPETQNFKTGKNSGQNLSPRNEHLPKQNQVNPLIIEDCMKKTSIEKECHDIKIAWKDVSEALDKIFFVLFNVIILITSLVFFLLILTSERVTIEMS